MFPQIIMSWNNDLPMAFLSDMSAHDFIDWAESLDTAQISFGLSETPGSICSWRSEDSISIPVLSGNRHEWFRCSFVIAESYRSDYKDYVRENGDTCARCPFIKTGTRGFETGTYEILWIEKRKKQFVVNHFISGKCQGAEHAESSASDGAFSHWFPYAVFPRISEGKEDRYHHCRLCGQRLCNLFQQGYCDDWSGRRWKGYWDAPGRRYHQAGKDLWVPGSYSQYWPTGDWLSGQRCNKAGRGEGL